MKSTPFSNNPDLHQFYFRITKILDRTNRREPKLIFEFKLLKKLYKKLNNTYKLIVSDYPLMLADF